MEKVQEKQRSDVDKVHIRPCTDIIDQAVRDGEEICEYIRWRRGTIVDCDEKAFCSATQRRKEKAAISFYMSVGFREVGQYCYRFVNIVAGVTDDAALQRVTVKIQKYIVNLKTRTQTRPCGYAFIVILVTRP